MVILIHLLFQSVPYTVRIVNTHRRFHPTFTETAEQIKGILAEVDPEWKVPVLIVGIPKGLLDTTDPDAILTYLLNLLAQADQIPGRHIERLEATFTLEAEHQTLFLSSGA